MKYAEDFENRRNFFTCPPNNERIFKKELKIIDKRLNEPLINVRDDSNHTSHPFVVQCIVQNCCEHFYYEDGLKKHLMEEHACDQ
jgi:hypothetical protein